MKTLEDAGLETRLEDWKPQFDERAVAAALVARSGEVLLRSRAYAVLEGAFAPDLAALEDASRSDRPSVAVAEVRHDGQTELVAYAVARAGTTANWSLPEEIRSAADRTPAALVVLASRAHPLDAPLRRACEAFGLTPTQTRVALEVIRTSSAKSAASNLGLSYDTAREALAEAMQRMQAPRLPALVHRIVSLAFGILPDSHSGELLGDIWGLSTRQAAIAALIAEGLSRRQAAASLGLSEAVVKKELAEAYQLLQVTSSATLARRVAEANALGWMIRSTGGDVTLAATGAEPLRFVHRPDGSRIALSDYGPRSGKPVLVVHSSMTSRVVAGSLRRALQQAGYRPIAIDRPGFGLSDALGGFDPLKDDPFAAAAADAEIVLDRLKLPRVDVVARGGAQFVLALQRRAPDRMDRVVLVNPDPPSRRSGAAVGPLGVLKEAYMSRPHLIRLWAGFLASQLTFERVSQIMARSMRGSAADEAAAADPENMADYYRSVRTFATGRYDGYVNEQIAFADRHRVEPPVLGTSRWTVLIGRQDMLHEHRQVLDYWRETLPDAKLELLADAGRLLALSHPDAVVAHLRG